MNNNILINNELDTEINNINKLFNNININPLALGRYWSFAPIDIPILKNKGSGAGGANTTFNGSSFEKKTSIENKLLENGYTKTIFNNKQTFGYYFEYVNENYKIIYLTQSGFRLYFKLKYNIDVYRNPDEAFLIIKEDKYYLKILEKKNQNVAGSVEDKLKTGQFNRREYEKMFKDSSLNIIISYSFCVSQYLKKQLNSNTKKYNNMKEIMAEDNINIFYGDDDNYFDKLFEWINEI